MKLFQLEAWLANKLSWIANNTRVLNIYNCQPNGLQMYISGAGLHLYN